MAYKIEKRTSTNKTSKRTGKVQFIVIHYTAGSSKSGAAYNVAEWFRTGNVQASADYIIDPEHIVKYNPDVTHRYTWAIGGGVPATIDGIKVRNSNSVSIEVCMSGDKPYTSAEIKRLRFMVMRLMDYFNIPAKHVVRHYDCNSIKKACPLYYSKRPNEWAALKKQVTN